MDGKCARTAARSESGRAYRPCVVKYRTTLHIGVQKGNHITFAVMMSSISCKEDHPVFITLVTNLREYRVIFIYDYNKCGLYRCPKF